MSFQYRIEYVTTLYQVTSPGSLDDIDARPGRIVN